MNEEKLNAGSERQLKTTGRMEWVGLMQRTVQQFLIV